VLLASRAGSRRLTRKCRSAAARSQRTPAGRLPRAHRRPQAGALPQLDLVTPCRRHHVHSGRRSTTGLEFARRVAPRSRAAPSSGAVCTRRCFRADRGQRCVDVVVARRERAGRGALADALAAGEPLDRRETASHSRIRARSRAHRREPHRPRRIPWETIPSTAPTWRGTSTLQEACPHPTSRGLPPSVRATSLLKMLL